MNVSIVQLDIAWEDKPATHRRVLSMLERTPPKRGGLLVLPEMFATGFSMNVAAIAEDAAGPSHKFVAEIAKRFGIHVIAGVVTRTPDGRGSNDAILVDSSGVERVRYRKMHPFRQELEHYAKGDAPITIDFEGWRLCPLVCYDLRFPEVFRHAAHRHRAELFVVIANWPIVREHHWTTLLTARAIENQAYVVGVNRAGTDPKFSYSGRSLIVDPYGKTIADAGNGECIVSADVDAEVVRSWRRDFPALPDIREGFVR
jgi:omega-amidase